MSPLDVPEVIPFNNIHTELIQEINYKRMLADQIDELLQNMDPRSELVGYLQTAYNIAYEEWERAHQDLMNITDL